MEKVQKFNQTEKSPKKLNDIKACLMNILCK